MKMPSKLIPLLAVMQFMVTAACTTSSASTTTEDSYTVALESYAVALDIGTGYARWCTQQSNRTSCKEDVQQTLALEVTVKSALADVNAKISAGDTAGTAVAQTAAEAAMKAASDFINSHPIGA